MHGVVTVSTQGDQVLLGVASIERGEKEVGPTVLLAISREFGKSVDWLLTGHER
jgi:hypothetical protein